MNGRRVRGALAQGGYPHRATREWEDQEGAGAQMAEGGQAAQEELSHAAQLDVRKTSGAPAVLVAKQPSARFGLAQWQQIGFRCSSEGPAHSAKLHRNSFQCQKGPKVILVTRLAPPHKAGSRSGRLPTRKARRANFPRKLKRLPQSRGAGKPRRSNSRDSGTSPCNATSFDPSKRRGAART